MLINARQSNLIIFLSLIFVTIAQFSIHLYIPSIPTITKDLHASVGAIQNSAALFLFAYGGSQLFYGPLSDYYGRRPILIMGLIILIIGIIIILFCDSVFVLLISRFIQGLGAGSLFVLARAILCDRFKEAELLSTTSLLTMVTSITPAIAPFIGGHIQDAFGWKSNFLLLLIYTLFILSILIFYLPETNIRQENIKFNFKKMWKNYQTLLRNRIFLIYTIALVVTFACQVLYLTIAPFVFQIELGLSAAEYGTWAILPGLGYFCGNFLSNRLAKIFSADILMLIGTFFILFAGIGILIEVYLESVTVIKLIFPSMLMGFGVGLVLPSAMFGTVASFYMIGATAAALSGFFQVTSGGVINSFASFFHFTTASALGGTFTACALVLLLILFVRNFVDKIS